MKRLLLLGLLMVCGGVSWAQGLNAHALSELPALYDALRLQNDTSGVASGAIVVYVWDGDCETCNETISELGRAGIFTQMQQERVQLYTLNLTNEKKAHSGASFIGIYRVARAPTFLFFKDGRLKKRLTASAVITPESFRAALSFIR